MADTTSPETSGESSGGEQAPLHAAIRCWLARAHPSPRQAESEWANGGVAMLPLGKLFDAVRVPGQLIHAAVGSDDPHTVDEALSNWLRGPVIRDTRIGSGSYYVLVPPDSQWEGPAPRLREGTYLTVPRIGRQMSPVTSWAVPPPRRGQLCDPAHLAALLGTAEPLKAIGP
ncbi:hypothetical protein [Streptomyces silvensis]|uniref:DNA primase/polymerase bifunctional N-terminal domain-containing protein n=1 Tax=Streptomyces silvensis TaxID=1765722 RepID=A0A0W7WS06_9ACTN|nr:hypothetical protein [Streptomyces silvensis]KUF13344.1 hypothetical protein AT728_33365 [Streptomyces silvensis]